MSTQGKAIFAARKLAELMELTGLKINGCGCCDSPWVYVNGEGGDILEGKDRITPENLRKHADWLEERGHVAWDPQEGPAPTQERAPGPVEGPKSEDLTMQDLVTSGILELYNHSAFR